MFPKKAVKRVRAALTPLFLPSLGTLGVGASDDGARVRSPRAAGRRLKAEQGSAVRDPGPASPALPRRPRRAHSNGGGDPTTPGLGGGAWPLCSRRNHEPLPPQVPEPIGAGSAIPLPAGDWVAVARYEEGRKGLDPLKSERSRIGA